MNNYYEELLTKLLNFLSFKPRSEKELEERLLKYIQSIQKRKKDKEDEVSQKDLLDIKNKVLERLKELGYINNEKYVDDVLESAKRSKKYSTRVLGEKLRKKGIAEDIIEKKLDEIRDEHDLAICLKLYDKKLPLLGSEDKYIRAAKMKRYLLGKGFPFAIISDVFDIRDDLK